MTFWTMLMVKVPEENAERVMQAIVARRILEECRDTIPRFLNGQLLKSRTDSSQICMICNWTEKAAYEQWLNGTVRAQQNTGRCLHTAFRRSAQGLTGMIRGHATGLLGRAGSVVDAMRIGTDLADPGPHSD